MTPDEDIPDGRRAQEIKLEVVEALKRDELVRKIVEEVRGKEKAGVGGLMKHPAFLLLIGFLLTGGFGTWLTYFWQSRQWSRQQEQLAQARVAEQRKAALNRSVEQKYAIADEIVKAVAETSTAAEDILIAYRQQLGDEEVAERRKYWQNQGSRHWRIKSKELRQRVTSNFKNRSATLLFEDIINLRRRVGVSIAALPNKVREIKASQGTEEEKSSKLIATVDPINDRINEIEEHLVKLMAVMVKEIREDESVAEPEAN